MPSLMSDLREFQSRPHPINGTLLTYFMLLRKRLSGIHQSFNSIFSRIQQNITNSHFIYKYCTLRHLSVSQKWKIGKRRPSCVLHDVFTERVNLVYPNLNGGGDKWDLYIYLYGMWDERREGTSWVGVLLLCTRGTVCENWAVIKKNFIEFFSS